MESLRFSIGKRFPNMYCGASYESFARNGSTVSYRYSYRAGCHYDCTVNLTGVIVSVSVDEMTPNACWTTLN